jgi:DNA-binding CsgD family transcriptional regulator
MGSVPAILARGAAAAAQGDEMVHLMRNFRPSYGRLLTTSLANQNEGARVLSTAGLALCLIGPSGGLLSPTPEFQKLIGDAIVVSDGKLRAARRDEDAAFQAVLSALTATSQFYDDAPPAVARLTRNDGTTLVAHGISIAGGSSLSWGAPVAILVVEAPDAFATGEEALCETFGLTSAEARLATRLAAGNSLRNAAAEEGITYETARSRLKTIFRKTDTTRQAELVLLLTRYR